MVTVQESVTREENLGTANIPLFLDRASCLPITVIAHPRVRSEPDATGRPLYYIYYHDISCENDLFILENDFDNSTVTVVINPGETTATVSIPLIDDDLLELTELFNVDIEIGANGTDYVAVRPPGFSQVQIVNEDCKLNLCTYVVLYEVAHQLLYMYKFSRDVNFTDDSNLGFSQFYFCGSLIITPCVSSVLQ